MIRVDVQPHMLRWARNRSGLDVLALAPRFPRLEDWEAGRARPTLKQLESFARATNTPIGFLFLTEPPVEAVPIPDFRTVRNARVGHPSPNLLETIYICQQRQEWYRHFVRSMGEEPLAFVGSARLTDDVVTTAATIRRTLEFDLEERQRLPTWTEALRRFIEQADGIGVLVMCSGVVLNNNRRPLDPDEFRGFALSDRLAPLVFLNGADTKAAQMFTLAHELAHIWLGQSALSDAGAATVPDNEVESWCNRVAAEMLRPLETPARVGAIPRKRGGELDIAPPARVSKRFARALISRTLEGHTLHRDAFRMLGLSRESTFRQLGRRLGVVG